MKRLTENEIRFIKETGITWTVVQCHEWERTDYNSYAEAIAIAHLNYQVDLDALMDKFDEYDGISLEYAATYLFYTFFTEEELKKLTSKQGLEWLEDMKYFCGYRKWDKSYVEQEINEALEVYSGNREFYECEDKEIWNREVEQCL